MIDKDEVGMVGVLYDVHSGIVKCKDYEQEIKDLGGKSEATLAEKLTKVIKEAQISE